MAKVKLKIGDTVRIKGDPLSNNFTVEEIIKREDAHNLYSLSPGLGFFKREEIYKIPVQSPASKLSAQNNFWQGRCRSVQTQINALARDLPYKSFQAFNHLRTISNLLAVQAKMIDNIVKDELEKLKQAKN